MYLDQMFAFAGAAVLLAAESLEAAGRTNSSARSRSSEAWTPEVTAVGLSPWLRSDPKEVTVRNSNNIQRLLSDYSKW